MDDASLNDAYELIQRGLYVDALELLEAAIGERTRQWDVYYLAGICCRHLDRYDDALVNYAHAIELNDSEAQVFLAAGIAKQLKGDLEGATHLLRRAIQLQPDFVLAHNSLGLTLKLLGWPNETLEAYGAAAELLMDAAFEDLKSSPEMAELLPTVVHDGGKYLHVTDEANERIRQHLKQNGLFAVLRNNMGGCYLELGDWTNAEGCFLESIEFTPEGMDYDPPRVGLEKLRKRTDRD